MASNTPGAGQQNPWDGVGPFNPYAFAISQALSQVDTIKIVKVIAVDTDAKTVDVQIAVNQMDGNNNATPHGTINSIPYAWAMGGKTAFQIDPAVGDLGVMIACDRDISAVKVAKAVANPGSLRKFSVSDGIYLFSIPGLSGIDPEQYIKWTDDGIEITAAHGNKITSDAGGWTFTGPVKFNDAVTAQQTIDVKGIATLEDALQLGGSLTSVSGGTYAHSIAITGTLGATDLLITGHASYTSHGHGGVTAGGAVTGPPT